MAIDLIIVTPEGERFSGEVENVVLPGSEGDFGVLEGHERFLAPLKAGIVELKTSEGVQYAALSGGFVNVSGESVKVLADACELAEDIDVSRAERARDRAQAALESMGDDQDLFNQEQLALQRASVRVQVGGMR